MKRRAAKYDGMRQRNLKNTERSVFSVVAIPSWFSSYISVLFKDVLII
jgi:hypothetical protein